MATFEVPVVRLAIEEHPNADLLEIARFGDYKSIVVKGHFKTGDLGVYIPEQSLLPEWLITALGLEGRLAGKQKNRVKAVKLRKVLSQGLICPLDLANDEDRPELTEGDNAIEYLGIVKYEPPIPTCMAGEVDNRMGYTMKYDVENLKWYPDVIAEGEQVVFTEKLHGTWACFGYHPRCGNVVTSKGLSGKGLAFKFNEMNANNLYVRTFNKMFDDGRTIIERYHALATDDEPIYFLGEIFGQGVQDLAYGMEKPQFRGFDIYLGHPTTGRYLDFDEKAKLFDQLGVQLVPILYRGIFSHEKVEEFTSGRETVSGRGACIREGIVILPVRERRDDDIGRVMLKSVSEKYLLRRNATEFN